MASGGVPASFGHTQAAKFLNGLLTRIPDFWLRTLLWRNWKHVLGYKRDKLTAPEE
jgi:hypothetical protein